MLDHYIEVDRLSHFLSELFHLLHIRLYRRTRAAVAARFRKSVRSYDSVCRYGGEEFTIILPDMRLEAAREVAERIRHDQEKSPESVTLSIGVTERRPGEDIPAWIERTDKCLYAAKNAGRNRVHSES